MAKNQYFLGALIIFLEFAVQRFEAVSGAILSRDQKCKVVGFGSWKDRTVWPQPYVKTVEEIKVFGVFIMDSYKQLLKRNLSYRFDKFEKAILSWSSRVLETLFQRVEVVKTLHCQEYFIWHQSCQCLKPWPKGLSKLLEDSCGHCQGRF